jgi:hypothetical protein
MRSAAPVLTATIAAALLVLALAAGWAAPGLPPQPLTLTRYARDKPARLLERPNEATVAAVADLHDYLDSVGAPAAAEPAPPPPRSIRLHVRPPPPPPPPDVAVVFRRQVEAVINREGEGLAILMSDSSVEGGRTRLLKAGDLFEGTWRVARLSMTEVILQNGQEQKRVPLYGAAGPAAGPE